MSTGGDGGDDGASSSRTPSVTSADGFLSPERQEYAQRQEVAAYSRLDDSALASHASSSANDDADDASSSALPSIPENEMRHGTLASAVFNLLSTMVGGGSLSLPLAFAQSGNALVGPVCLVGMACISEFCMRCLVDGGEAVKEKERKMTAQRRARRTGGHDGHEEDGNEGDDADEAEEDEGDDPRRKGHITYELIASHAFGPSSLYLSMALIAVICFFATVGYAVLLRDLLEPYVDYFVPPGEGTGGGPTLARNVGMWLVVLGVTPLCRLTELTSLRHVGAMSMVAVLTLGFCVAYRSWECNFSPAETDGSNSTGTYHGHGSHNDSHFGHGYGEDKHHTDSGGSAHIHPRHDPNWLDYLTFVPRSVSSLLSALPIFVSCFICHYNVPPVCNELTHATTSRCYSVIRYTVWCAFSFYLLVGFAGSMYGNCTPSGTVQGNVLLDFDEDDPLLLIGRTALACTVTLAFPMLVIPPRNIALRGWGMWSLRRERARLEEIELRHQMEQYAEENGHGHVGDRDDGDGHKRQSRFTNLLQRGRGTTHSPSGAFPPTLSVPEDEIGITTTTTEDEIGVTMTTDGSVEGNALTEPLLREEERHEDYDIPPNATANGATSGQGGATSRLDPTALETQLPPPTSRSLLLTAIVLFWSAASVACCVKSIDVVWDLLGSSLSMCLGFLIPCGSYAVLFGGDDGKRGQAHRAQGGEGAGDEEGGEDGDGPSGEDDDGEGHDGNGAATSSKAEKTKLLSARGVVGVFVPLMVVCTANAFYRTFLEK